MTAPDGPVKGTTLGQGFQHLAKAILAVAEQMKVANTLLAMRLNDRDLWATSDDLPQYREIRRQLGLTE